MIAATRRSSRRGRLVTGFGLVVSLALLVGCASPSPSPARPASDVISCQPFGYTPAPIAFSFPPGPVAASEAELTAVALFRACQLPTVRDVTFSSRAATGTRAGPNDGQGVWLVEVSATVPVPSAEGGGSYQSHVLIEVNQATGIPTVIAYG
jgi:hypothetical protein